LTFGSAVIWDTGEIVKMSMDRYEEEYARQAAARAMLDFATDDTQIIRGRPICYPAPVNSQMATRSISPRQRSGDIQVIAEVQQPQPVNAQVARGNAGKQRSTDDTQVIRGICDPAPVNSQIATRSISPRQRVGDVQITIHGYTAAPTC
jgi:hypothetical protein